MEGSTVAVCVFTLIRLQGIYAAYRYGNVTKGAAFPCRCTEGCYPDNGTCITGGCQPVLPLGNIWRGDGCRIGNVALGKHSYQSGTHDGLHPGLAVDGMVGPGRHSGQCAYLSTYYLKSLWWYADLETVHVIYSVTLYNMDDPFYWTLYGFRIRIGNNTDVDSNPVCNEQSQTAIPRGGSHTYECATPMYGRFVGIRRNKAQLNGVYATLCELVAVGRSVVDCGQCPATSSCDDYHGCDQCHNGTRLPDCKEGCVAGQFGLNCEETCSSHCNDSLACDVTNGTCLTGCQGSPDNANADWWLGIKCDVHVPSFDALSIRNISTTTVSSRSVGLRWTDTLAVSDLVVRYFGFKVYYRLQNDTQWIPGRQVAYNNSLWKTFVLTNLDPNTTVVITVSAIRTSPKGMIQRTAIGDASNLFLVVTTMPVEERKKLVTQGTSEPRVVGHDIRIFAVTGGAVGGVVIGGIIVVIVVVFLRRSSSQRESQCQQATEENTSGANQMTTEETRSSVFGNPTYETLIREDNPAIPNEYATLESRTLVPTCQIPNCYESMEKLYENSNEFSFKN